MAAGDCEVRWGVEEEALQRNSSSFLPHSTFPYLLREGPRPVGMHPFYSPTL
jgi:hypothetical protein